jgi:serpin B
MRTFFGADVRSGDFGPTTVADMNRWASEQTNGLIPRVVEELSEDMVVMLMNALYFKGSWRVQFEPSRTTSQRFTRGDGVAQPVPMMQRTGRMGYTSHAGAQWAELPYGNTAYVMTVVLPDSSTTAGQWLAASSAASLDAGFARVLEQSVDLSMPRFRLKVGYQLKPALSAMGMGVAFDRNAADFSRIAENLFVTHVKQDVYIDVNEEGTEAAAVTQVGIGLVSVPVVPAMTIDRPFLFFIRDRIGGTLLFAGLVNNPIAQ